MYFLTNRNKKNRLKMSLQSSKKERTMRTMEGTDFNSQLSKSAVNDAKCITVLQEMSAMDTAVPVDDLEEQHYGDYKFNVEGSDKQHYLEIKNDSYTDVNFGFEIWSNKGLKEGWAHPESTDYHYSNIAYHFHVEKVIYVFTFKAMMDYIKSINWDHALTSVNARQKNHSQIKKVSVKDFVKTLGDKVKIYDYSQEYLMYAIDY